MKKLPSVGYEQIVQALRKDNWVIVGKKGSQIRMQKRTATEVLKLTLPAHRPIKKSTLQHIIKGSRLPINHLEDVV